MAQSFHNIQKIPFPDCIKPAAQLVENFCVTNSSSQSAISYLPNDFISAYIFDAKIPKTAQQRRAIKELQISLTLCQYFREMTHRSYAFQVFDLILSDKRSGPFVDGDFQLTLLEVAIATGHSELLNVFATWLVQNKDRVHSAVSLFQTVLKRHSTSSKGDHGEGLFAKILWLSPSMFALLLAAYSNDLCQPLSILQEPKTAESQQYLLAVLRQLTACFQTQPQAVITQAPIKSNYITIDCVLTGSLRLALTCLCLRPADNQVKQTTAASRLYTAGAELFRAVVRTIVQGPSCRIPGKTGQWGSNAIVNEQQLIVPLAKLMKSISSPLNGWSPSIQAAIPLSIDSLLMVIKCLLHAGLLVPTSKDAVYQSLNEVSERVDSSTRLWFSSSNS